MIRGYFDPTAPRPVPKVRVALSLPGNAEPWVFVVDTGAMVTMLNPRDAISPVGIDPTNPMALVDTLSGPVQGVGGRSSNAIVPAMYGLIHTDSTIQILPGVIFVARLTASNQRLNSLLGWDVLQNFQLPADFRTDQVLLRKSGNGNRTKRSHRTSSSQVDATSFVDARPA